MPDICRGGGVTGTACYANSERSPLRCSLTSRKAPSLLQSGSLLLLPPGAVKPLLALQTSCISSVFSAAEISNIHLIGGWRECTAGLRTCCSNTNTHAAKLQRSNVQTSPATNTASAARQVSCEKLLAAQAEDTAIVERRDGWRCYVSVSADWNTAEFIRFQISKVTTSRWNPRKPNTGSYTPERRHNGWEYGPFGNITIDKDGFTVNVGQI